MRVLLVDDHALFTKSLEIALDECPEIESFRSTMELENLISLIQKETPDIILMDINLGQQNKEDGLFLAKTILEQVPEQKIIILSGYDLPVYRYEAEKIGAKGFINKNVEPAELVGLLLQIEQGGTYFIQTAFIEELTDSEKRVLQSVASGIKRKEIAKQLFISERTLSNHLQHIFEKLQVTSVVEAVTKAIQMGYISPIC